jgi:glycosyltransferase involved in cell wall biosynthesis
MKVAFDASSISGYSGINTYTRKLIGALCTEFPEDLFVLLTTSSSRRQRKLRELFGPAPNIRIKSGLLNPIALGPSLRRLTFLMRGLALGLAARKVDVLHLTQPYRERVRASNIVITAHDLFPLVLDDYAREAVLDEFRNNARFMLRQARGVIVYTRTIRDQIESVFPGVAGDVSIIPAAADESFHPTGEAPFAQIPESKRPQAACFFYVGSAYPRKNLPRVLRAYLDLPAEIRAEHPLVFVLTGAKLHRAEFARTNADLLADPSVHLLDPVTDPELVRIYGSAAALVFPSLGEGFGLPVIEAMRCGCPVITSTTSCLPEVAGDAALLVNPEDPAAITDAMRRIISEEGLARQLRVRGLEHSREFTWERTARLTMEAYRSAAGI